MAKNPLGKTLLRNVIRHTGAHNKIQEESEMWKMRGHEVHKSTHKPFPATESTRGMMHCDRDQSEGLRRTRERSEHDDRDARYWTRKLYDFEDKDPDRWGHSGFKELYPEEFESESEHNGTVKKHRSSKKAKSEKETSKKSSRKKKKKKKKQKKTTCSSDNSSSDDSSAAEKKKKRTKNQHKKKKSARKKEDSSSVDSDSENERDRWKHSRKRRKQDSNKDLSPDIGKKRRKEAGEDGSDTCRE